jgi:hypothetical protein
VQAIDGEPVREGAALSWAAGTVGVLSRKSAPRSGLEGRVLLEQSPVAGKPLFDVGLYEHGGARDQHPAKVVQERSPDHQALLMTLFPPGVREVDEGGSDAPWDEAGQALARVLREDATASTVPELT